jgi:RNA polymerase sigma-70 factor (ECF subfamily)
MEDGAALDPDFARLLERGRRAWPTLTLAPETFGTRLARHAKQTSDPSQFLASVHAEDFYLACGVVEQDRAALECFEQHFMTQVGEYVLRVTVDHDLVTEVRQRLRQAIVVGDPPPPKLLEYSGKGALGGWIRIMAIRTALNLLRGKGLSDEEASEVEPRVVMDPELAFVKAQAQHLFREAFLRALDSLPVQERSLLRLHYVEGLTMDQLSRMYKTPRSTIARRVNEVRQAILEATEQLLRDGHRLSTSEVQSLIHGAASHLQLTLSKFLKE